MNREKQFIKFAARYDGIIIYGAGLVGGLTAKRLRAWKLSKKVIGMAVSAKKSDGDSREKIEGFSVYIIDELVKYKKDALVIIATMPALHDEIKEILEKKKFHNVFAVNARLYKSFSRNYIRDFQRQHQTVFPENAETRILFMASDNNRTSGAFLCMTELCGMLSNRDIAVLVVLPLYGNGEEVLLQKGIPYTYIPSKDWGYKVSENRSPLKKLSFCAGLLANIKAKWTLMRVIKKQKVDLVHCNTTYTYIGAVAASACNVPFVWHLRENMENQGYRIFALDRALKLMRKAGKLIAVSGYIKSLIPLKDENLVAVIYDSVETGKKELEGRKILEQKTIQMVIVGAITPFKGQEDLVKACGVLIKREITDFHLLIVGAGEKSYIEMIEDEICRQNLEKHVTLYGVSNDVCSLYEKSDIAFACGAKEAYGRTTVEAMLSGCLVVGVDCGATPELIRHGETGLLYESGNIESLAECIIKAISKREWCQEIARSGQAYAMKRFTKESSLRQILAVYDEVMKNDSV